MHALCEGKYIINYLAYLLRIQREMPIRYIDVKPSIHAKRCRSDSRTIQEGMLSGDQTIGELRVSAVLGHK